MGSAQACGVDDAQCTLPSLRASFSTRAKRSLADNPFNDARTSSMEAANKTSNDNPKMSKPDKALGKKDFGLRIQSPQPKQTTQFIYLYSRVCKDYRCNRSHLIP